MYLSRGATHPLVRHIPNQSKGFGEKRGFIVFRSQDPGGRHCQARLNLIFNCFSACVSVDEVGDRQIPHLAGIRSVHNVLVLASEVNSITLLSPVYGVDVVVAEGGDYPQMFRGKTYLFGASCSVGAISFGGRGEGALRSDQGG